jgi:hypothetical protein
MLKAEKLKAEGNRNAMVDETFLKRRLSPTLSSTGVEAREKDRRAGSVRTGLMANKRKAKMLKC